MLISRHYSINMHIDMCRDYSYFISDTQVLFIWLCMTFTFTKHYLYLSMTFGYFFTTLVLVRMLQWAYLAFDKNVNKLSHKRYKRIGKDTDGLLFNHHSSTALLWKYFF